MIKWVERKLGDLVQIGSSKRIYYKEYVTNGIPFYRSKEVIEKHNGRSISTELFISYERFNEIKDKFGSPQKEDILLTSVGTLGIPWIINTNEEFYFKDGNLIWFQEFGSQIDNKFLYYWFISPIGKHELKMSSIGSTQPALTIRGLKALDILLPPLPEQRAIAGVLSSLDDKIDLLHRQNKTLEALAQTLFRQWFVEEAEDDWEKGILSDFCDVIDCLHAKKPKEIEPDENSKYLLQVYNIADGGYIDLSKKYFVSDEDYDEWVRRIELLGGDLVISKTGRVGAIGQIPYYLKAGIGRNLVAIHPKEPFTPEYLKELMFSKWMIRKIHLNTSDGTILRSLHVKSIAALPVIFPGKECIDKYSETISPIHRKIQENLKSIETLEKLRDMLLPKLMSGEVRVSL